MKKAKNEIIGFLTELILISAFIAIIYVTTFVIMRLR